MFWNQADALATLGRWREAAAAATTAAGSGVDHWRPRCQIALLHWAGGDEAAHRAACTDLLTRRGPSAAAAEAGALLAACLVDAKDSAEANEVLSIARRAAAANSHDPAGMALVGAALIRAGQNSEGLRTLEVALPSLQSAGSAASGLLPISSVRLLGETMLLVAYRERGDSAALIRQGSAVQELVDTLKTTAPYFCDLGQSWPTAFALRFAQRELARLPGSGNR